MCWIDEPLYLIDQEILKQSKLSQKKAHFLNKEPTGYIRLSSDPNLTSGPDKTDGRPVLPGHI